MTRCAMPKKKPAAFGQTYRQVLRFTLRHWANQPWRIAGLFLLFLLSAIADVITPIYAGRLADAVASADWVQESTPERIEVKHAVLRQIQAACKQAAIVGSSTSGFMPSELQEGSDRPEQILVAHPYNPVYLLPVVEVVASPRVPVEGVDRAEQILKSIGMKPIILKSEIPAHVGDRLLEAVWREALWLIKDGVATTEQIDDIMTHGFGLRWAQKGLFETYRTAGGEAGMKHFLEQFSVYRQVILLLNLF